MFELSDLYHFNETSVVKKAGEATDNVGSYIDTSYKAAIQVLYWVYNHFIYDSNSLVFTTSKNVPYRYGDLFLSDLYILNNVSNGYYRGDCTEYTVLYISFMRALNVPSRQMEITLWTAEDHSKWIGHAFAEVWVTKPSGSGYFWMHADPTWDKYNQPSVYRNDQRFYGIGGVRVWQGANDSINTDDDWVWHNGQPVIEVDHQKLKDGVWYDASPVQADFKPETTFEYTGPNNY